MRKGISPLLAEILLIATAIMIGVVVFSWIGGFSNSQVKESNNRYDQVIDCSTVNGQIVEFFFYLKTHTFKLMVSTSDGSKQYPIKKIIITNTKGEKCEKDVNELVESGKLAEIDGSCSIINSCNDFYSIYISSSCVNKGIYYGGRLIDVGEDICKLEENGLSIK